MSMCGRGQHNVVKQITLQSKIKKQLFPGNFPGGPWLRLPAFTVGDMISIPGQGTKSNEIIEVAPREEIQR